MPFSLSRLSFLLFLLSFGPCHVTAQDCENYGFLNGSACACPVGFGGSSCSQPGCGGTIFQGLQRSLASTSSGPYSNLTASSCSCQNGWTGLGCNVCQTANACQSAYSAAVGTSSQIPGSSSSGQNDTMVCNTASRVYASSQMSCHVVNPTLQALYPLDSYLNIERTIQPSLSPLPNVTSSGGAGTVYAQLFYAGVEQFYCKADSCVQQALNDTQGSTSWICQNLQCTCRPGSSFCGAVTASNLTSTIDGLDGSLEIDCGGVDNSTNTATCHFKQTVLNQLFGSSGLTLQGCTFGECVRQSAIDSSTISSASSSGGTSLSGGVIAGLVVIGGLILLALILLFWGLYRQRIVRKAGYIRDKGRRATLEWTDVSYIIPKATGASAWIERWNGDTKFSNDDKTILDSVSGRVQAGQMMAVFGPSGAGKTTLVEILAGKSKSAKIMGTVKVSFHNGSAPPQIGFVPQQDVLPPTLTVFEALLFAARLRLPEGKSDIEKVRRVEEIMEKLGIAQLRNVKIGYSDNSGGSRARGISGGEMRRVSVGLELIADPDILILDEPTSGLDSVSASRVANVLHSIAHDPINPIPVIASIHQPSSQLYQKFDTILLLSHGRALYCGPGSLSPVDYFTSLGTRGDMSVPVYPAGYNVADYLLDVASDPPVGLFNLPAEKVASPSLTVADSGTQGYSEKISMGTAEMVLIGEDIQQARDQSLWNNVSSPWRSDSMTTFLTQLQVLSGREWKILRRDKTLFLTHISVAVVLGVFCGGLYYKTGISIAGFQSRIGSLFFLGSLVAFSSLSALYNIVEIRPLFVRERSSSYYSPTAWLLSRFLFDVVPIRIVPTLIVSTITYWMTGLSPHAANFFKFLFIIVLYTLTVALFNFLLGTFFHNGGIAILLSALSALYQMVFAGFFVHLNSIPPVLRWLQWICPLKYTLEALSVNEVGSGLMIQDTLQGVPVNVSASLIMQLLFGFGLKNYYRDVLVLFGFIAAFGLGVIAVVWWKVREKR